MLSRELTITTGINEEYTTYPHYAELTDRNDTWLGTSYGSTDIEAVSRIIKTIIDSVDDHACHIWRDWDN